MWPQYGYSREFLWRLARAYTDMYESAEDKLEKMVYEQQGNNILIILFPPNSLHSHLFTVLYYSS